MLATPSTIPPVATPSHHVEDADADPFVLYARSLHDYTLRLWTESRRIAEEKSRIRAAAGGPATKTKGDLDGEDKPTTVPPAKA